MGSSICAWALRGPTTWNRVACESCSPWYPTLSIYRLTAVRNRVSLTYWGGLSAFGLVGQLARRVHRAPLGPTRMDFGESWLFGFQHGFG
jgi:hypothetical protein